MTKLYNRKHILFSKFCNPHFTKMFSKEKKENLHTKELWEALSENDKEQNWFNTVHTFNETYICAINRWDWVSLWYSIMAMTCAINYQIIS